ncbi:MAG: hypothetical protein ACI9MR_000084 [Myxococcota bacterium]|jgi:hypothetical protein
MMKHTTRTWIFAALIGGLAMGCAESASDTAEKPFADPDLSVLSVGKADGISKYLTTIVGSLNIDDHVDAEIDYPDWFHGYTMELTAGQTVEMHVAANAHGYVRVYGPATGEADGLPTFRRALYRAKTQRVAGQHSRAFEVEAPEDGTYMVVYGPQYVWEAKYSISVSCLGGCLPEDACLNDAECAEGEFCGHNGVFCITTPCDVSYNVCQPIEDDGQCENNDDCTDGFCGCTDSTCETRECRPFSAEGERCGGFVRPPDVRVCAPEFRCVSPRFIADIPGNCGVMATVRELVADPEAFDGRFVAVDGSIETDYAMCTKIGCSPENQCCNSCSAEQKLHDDKYGVDNGVTGVSLSNADVANYGCTGNECNYADQCTVTDGAYWLAGWFSYQDEWTLKLDVKRQFNSF